MNEVNGYEQAQSVETFIEPQVHPDIDNYFRERLSRVKVIKQGQGKLRDRGKKFVQRLDTIEADEALLTALAKAGMVEEAEAIERERAIEGRSISPEGEIQRLQGLWIAAARGDFSDVSSEVAHDISDINRWLRVRRQNPLTQEDNNRYDTSVAELAEWQVGLQETPVDTSSRLGRQIHKTVAGLIQQRDSSTIGKLTKQLKNLQKVQNAITTFQSLPQAK